MGVVDPQGLFPYEAQQRVRVALLQDLGGHIAAPPVVPGAPDRADTAASDRVDQFVPAGEDLTHGCASLLPFDYLRCFPETSDTTPPDGSSSWHSLVAVPHVLPVSDTTPRVAPRPRARLPNPERLPGRGAQLWWDW